MADNPEMVVVDPDAPSDASVKQSLMSLPTWEEWLQQQGFIKGEKYHRATSSLEWNRQWLQYGRGWRIQVAPASDTIHVTVYNNILGRRHHLGSRAGISERSVQRVVAKLIAEIERPVSDATKKRRIKDYLQTVPPETREDYEPYPNGPVLPFTEARPIRRPIPDDPAELDKEQMDQMLDRVQVRCFQKGQRVRVRNPQSSRLHDLLGTVVDASPHACYVALDSFVAAGDPDPFRFTEDEVVPVYENQEFDPDDPAPYIEALDYLTPLKKLGYVEHQRDSYLKHLYFNDEKQGILTFGTAPMPNRQSAFTVVIFIDYYQGGESERIADMAVEAMDVIERLRELELLAGSTSNIAEFARKLADTKYPHSTVFSHYDYLVHLFGESVLTESENVDDPAHYVQELHRHADVINLFREKHVRMGRRMSSERPYYRMFWIPSAVTDVSYDIYLEPKPDGSWSITAEGNKEFQDQVGVDWQEEFDIEQEWTIPAGTSVEQMRLLVADILSDLRKYQGPEEPTVEERDVDDIDEGIDDPPESTEQLLPTRTDFFKQEGYVYKADYKGNPHWEKKWPLPLPIKTGKTILTDLMIHPGHGQVWYSLVDAAGKPKGGYSVRLPGGDTPYTTNLRRALLKMRHVAERMPADVNFNDMFTFLRVAFDKVQSEVESESRTVTESEDDIDFEQYVKTSANYNPVQLLSAKDVRKIVRDTGYKINTLYHSKRTTGYSMRIAPGTPEQLQSMKESPEREANRVLQLIRQGIVKRLPMLGKIERGMYNLDDKLQVHCWSWGSPRYPENPDDPRNYLLYVDIQPSDHQRRGPSGVMLPESAENPDQIEDLSAYLKSTSDPITVLKEAGYAYGKDSNGKLRWQKFWPLPRPIKRSTDPWASTLTHLWVSPDPWGQLVYSLVEKTPTAFHNRADGGYIIVSPVRRAASVEDADYTTSVRRMLLKVEALARNLPAEATDLDSLRQYVFQGMERIKDEVNKEAVPTWSESVDDPQSALDAETYAADTLQPERFMPDLGYQEDGGYWKKSFGNTMFTVWFKDNLTFDFRVYERDADLWRIRGASLGHPLSILRRNLELWEKQLADNTLLAESLVSEGVDDPLKDVLNKLAKAQYCPRCGSHETKCIGTHETLPGGYGVSGFPQEFWECNACGDKFLWDDNRSVGFKMEGIDDPDDPEAMLKRARAPKMGELVTVICPMCGHKHESFKNWPDDAPREWGFACPSCASHIPLTNIIIESDDDIDPTQYAKTTYDPAEFLKSQGWLYYATQGQEYYTKSFPMPLPYRLGGMTFTDVQVRLGVPRNLHASSWVSVFFVGANGTGMPVQGYTLHSQQLYGWEGEDEAPDNFHDINMPIRRFALSIENVLRNAEWPDNETAAVLASSRVQHAVSLLVRSLNEQAHVPLDPNIRESVDDPKEVSQLLSNQAEYATQTLARLGFEKRADGTWRRVRDGVAIDVSNQNDIWLVDAHVWTGQHWQRYIWNWRWHSEGDKRLEDMIDTVMATLNKECPAVRESVDDPVDPEAVLQQLPPQTFVTFTRRFEEDQEFAETNFPGEPLEQALGKQLLREIAEAKVFDMSTIRVVGFERVDDDVYKVKLAFTGDYGSDENLRDLIQSTYREGAVAGEFNIEQYRSAPVEAHQVQCRHCRRPIRQENGVWVDPEATGDDSVWRETCDANDTFTAEHEPNDPTRSFGPQTEAFDPDDPEAMLKSHPGFTYRETSYIGTMVFVNGPGEDKSDWPQDIGRIVRGPSPNPEVNPEQRWYVIGVRGVHPDKLGELGFGIANKPKTFDSPDDAANAIWRVWSQQPEKKRKGYLLP